MPSAACTKSRTALGSAPISVCGKITPSCMVWLLCLMRSLHLTSPLGGQYHGALTRVKRKKGERSDARDMCLGPMGGAQITGCEFSVAQELLVMATGEGNSGMRGCVLME